MICMFDCYISEEELPLIMTFSEVQDILMISRHTLMKLLAKDELHGFKAGRQWRITKDELLKFINSSGTP